jgi:hypothetical protein
MRKVSRLRRMVLREGLDAREAVRRVTGVPLAEVARRLGVRRTDLNMALAPHWYGRPYLHIRRALELELGVPTYSLDTILTRGDNAKGKDH